MDTTRDLSENFKYQKIKDKFRQIGLIQRDPILMIALVFSFIFLIIFILYPIFRTILRGFISDQNQIDLTQIARYFDGTILDKFTAFLKNAGLILQETKKYGVTYRSVFWDTIKMGTVGSLTQQNSGSWKKNSRITRKQKVLSIV